jgi:hypothetical protein
MTPDFVTSHLAGLLLATTGHAAAGGGVTTWQIVLIGIGVPLVLIAVGVLLRWAWVGRRSASSPTS